MPDDPPPPFSSDLLSSKLRPPRLRVALIDRPQLRAKLAEGLSRRLTLVHAPAGFGKTTLLTQWFAQVRAANRPAAWFTFDEEDSDPLLFLAYLADSFSDLAPALTRVAKHSRESREDSNRANPRTVRRVMTLILNELGTLRDPVIVFDDYHFVSASDMHELIMQLVRSAPDNLHILLASRNRTPLAVSSLSVQGQVMDIGAEDLRLSADEVAQMFGGELTPQSVQRLFTRTDGWAMAVQMARVWTQDGKHTSRMIERFSAAEGDVATYLTEQIMRELPEPVQQFLIQIAIVDEINGDLAEALSANADSWRVLDSLAHLDALLAPLDGGGGWRRFHPLFASYLRGRAQSLGEERLRGQHMAASDWFARHGNLERAVRHAALGGNYLAAAGLIENAGGVWLTVEHGVHRLRRLLDHIPATLIDRRPRLRIARALLWIKDGRAEDARREIDELRSSSRDSSWTKDAERDVLIIGAAITGQGEEGVPQEVLVAIKELIASNAGGSPWLQAVRNEVLCTAYIRQGDALLAQAAGREAVSIYEHYGTAAGRIFSRLHLGGALLVQGKLSEALDVLSTAERMGVELIPDDTSTLAMVRVFLAHTKYERNDLAGAAELCETALAELEHAQGSLELHHSGYWVASGLHLARGDGHGALRSIERGLSTAELQSLKRLRRVLEYRRIDILIRSDPSAAPSLGSALETFREQREDMTFLEREVAVLTLARLAIFAKQETIALELLLSMLGPCEERGRGRPVIHLLILLALTHRQRGALEEAADAIRRALALAAREQARRPFLDEGEGIIVLLDDALKQLRIGSLAPDEVRLLAEIFSARLDPEGKHSQDPAQIFKAREREVLAGLREGLPNKAIARRLEVTDDAIKYHLKNIYAKLGVSDRAMAVAVAQKYGIIG